MGYKKRKYKKRKRKYKKRKRKKGIKRKRMKKRIGHYLYIGAVGLGRYGIRKYKERQERKKMRLRRKQISGYDDSGLSLSRKPLKPVKEIQHKVKRRKGFTLGRYRY